MGTTKHFRHLWTAVEPRLLPYTEIDKIRWDAAVLAARNTAVYGMSWYLDACFPGWCGLVYGDYEQVMCVPLRRKWGISYAYQPLFVQQSGIFSRVALTAGDVSRFLRFLDKKVGGVRLYLTPECTGKTSGFDTETRYSQYVSLVPSLDEIRKKYSENARRNIKKAAKNGLSLQFAGTPGSVVEAFGNQPGEHVERIGEAGFQRLARLLHRLQEHTDCLVPQVRDTEGRLLYTAFFSVSGGRALYVKGAGTEQAKNTGAGHFLMDAMIEQYRSAGCTVFDFGGAHAGNVRAFNRQFGADEFEYLCFNGGYLPSFLRK